MADPHPAEQIQSHVDEMCRGECQCPNGVHACVIPYKRGNERKAEMMNQAHSTNLHEYKSIAIRVDS